ncbi:Na+/H+ antiporter subunit E [Candidatus Omnitrophota bacterium]
MRVIKSKIILFFVAYLVWCFLTWIPDWQHLVIGAFVALFVSIITGDLFLERPHTLAHTPRYFYFLFHYAPVFLWECLKANIDVAYRIIHPALPIKPGIVKVKTTLTTDVALTFLANSITLTPGTMTVDIDREDGVLYIHWINTKTTDVEEATEEIVKRFEKILKKVFE